MDQRTGRALDERIIEGAAPTKPREFICVGGIYEVREITAILPEAAASIYARWAFSRYGVILPRVIVGGDIFATVATDVIVTAFPITERY